MKIEIGDKVSFKKVVKGNYTISEDMSKILDNYCIVRNVSNEKILINCYKEDVWIPKSFVEKIVSKHLTNKEKRRIEELNSEFNSEFEKYKIVKLRKFFDNYVVYIVGAISLLLVVLTIYFDSWQLALLDIGVIITAIIGYISICKISDSKYLKLIAKAKALITKKEYGRLKNYLYF